MNSSEENNSSACCELDQNLELLRQTYLFSGIPLETLKVIAYLCVRESFKKGEHLFHQGEDDGQAFFILSGEAVLERTDADNVRGIRLYRAGEFIGGLSLLGSTRRLFSLKAETDMSCLILNREKFARTLEQFQNLVPRILKALVGVIVTWEEAFLSDRADECGGCLKNLGVSLL